MPEYTEQAEFKGNILLSSCSLHSQRCTLANTQMQTHAGIHLPSQTLYMYAIFSYSSVYTTHVCMHTHKNAATDHARHTHSPPQPRLFPFIREGRNISAEWPEVWKQSAQVLQGERHKTRACLTKSWSEKQKDQIKCQQKGQHDRLLFPEATGNFFLYFRKENGNWKNSG